MTKPTYEEVAKALDIALFKIEEMFYNGIFDAPVKENVNKTIEPLKKVNESANKEINKETTKQDSLGHQRGVIREELDLLSVDFSHITVTGTAEKVYEIFSRITKIQDLADRYEYEDNND